MGACSFCLSSVSFCHIALVVLGVSFTAVSAHRETLLQLSPWEHLKNPTAWSQVPANPHAEDLYPLSAFAALLARGCGWSEPRSEANLVVTHPIRDTKPRNGSLMRGIYGSTRDSQRGNHWSSGPHHLPLGSFLFGGKHLHPWLLTPTMSPAWEAKLPRKCCHHGGQLWLHWGLIDPLLFCLIWVWQLEIEFLLNHHQTSTPGLTFGQMIYTNKLHKEVKFTCRIKAK